MKLCYVIAEARAIADLIEFEDGLMLTRINVPREHRGKGFARRLLHDVLTAADAERIVLYLIISPSDGLTCGALERWYERRGFRKVKDRLGLWKREPVSPS